MKFRLASSCLHSPGLMLACHAKAYREDTDDQSNAPPRPGAGHWRQPFIATHARAQAPWPTKPVRFIVPFPPGQAADIFARLMAERLTDVWKQQVVVENKAGGSGIPAIETGKAAAPDGYTVMVVSSGTFGVNPSLYPDLPYKPLVDFKPISNIFLVPLVIVAHP